MPSRWWHSSAMGDAFASVRRKSDLVATARSANSWIASDSVAHSKLMGSPDLGNDNDGTGQTGPVAPPFTDFLRVVRDEGPADYPYLWMIDLLPDDPRVLLEIVVSRPVEETFLFSFPVPHFTPFLVRIERESVLYLSTRSSIESALKQYQPDMTVAMPFDAGTHISELLQRYAQWDASGRPR